MAAAVRSKNKDRDKKDLAVKDLVAVKDLDLLAIKDLPVVGQGTFGVVCALSAHQVRKNSRRLECMYSSSSSSNSGDDGEDVADLRYDLSPSIIREATVLRHLCALRAQVCPPVQHMQVSARHPTCSIFMTRGVPLSAASAWSTQDRAHTALQLLRTGVRMFGVGIRHRDLSPNNVVLMPTSGGDAGGAASSAAWVIDWGFAGTSAHDCLTGVQPGTMQFSAPEVYMVAPGAPFDSARADVWSLASVILSMFVDVAKLWPAVFGKLDVHGTEERALAAARARVQSLAQDFCCGQSCAALATLPGCSALLLGRLCDGSCRAWHATPAVQAAFKDHGDLLDVLVHMLALDPPERWSWELVAAHPAVACAQDLKALADRRGSLVRLRFPWVLRAKAPVAVPFLDSMVRVLMVGGGLRAMSAMALCVPLFEAWLCAPPSSRCPDRVPPEWMAEAAARVSAKFLDVFDEVTCASSSHLVDQDVMCEALLLRHDHIPPLPLLADDNPMATAMHLLLQHCPDAPQAHDGAVHRTLVTVLSLLLADHRSCSPTSCGKLLWDNAQQWLACKGGSPAGFVPTWRQVPVPLPSTLALSVLRRHF